ncbi:MAG: Polyketide cyclase / dehydrase and lipid transport [Solirubrobacterales bacterium]|jgi:uncharacterized protein YndB with AHSA1/START domain|nr:Polyketide cyclase / dehydrase and lipid transport [Solirubrobacterales bacterium]
MVESRTEGVIDAPLARVWSLATDPDRQTDWWPDQLEFERLDPEFTEGCRIRSVTKRPWPLSNFESTLEVAELDPGREVFIRCMDSGSFTRIVCTEAQGGTFLEVRAGTEPKNLNARLMDNALGKRFFRRWVAHALDHLRTAAEHERPAAGASAGNA